MAIESDEHTLARAITAEMRAAFTYATIAQLAYDMGQRERGDQSFARAQQACASAKRSVQFLSQGGQELICSQFELLDPVLNACRDQRSHFHSTLRQPSLS